jgi:DNA repair protein RadD
MNNRLTDPEINYETLAFPEPREFQAKAHENLRIGASVGGGNHKNQILMAPTGAGKTYLGLRIISEALKKGKKAMFLCDRESLIEQTSNVSDNYGLAAHGVIKANHWRVNKMPFQIASAQTLQSRGFPYDIDVLVIDEVHTQYKVWADYVANCRAHVLGLSATPFSRGLGLLFSNLVNAATMAELTGQGVLVPMRVFSCTQIDMRGAKVVAGEWSKDEVARRGMAIVGDVVKEWLEYAGGLKTIVFGASIVDCEAITRQFAGHGINARLYTSHTKSDEREEILKEYRKPDSAIRVLVSVEALAKGFDVPDVGCVVDCRPMRKSLSTVMQMWGRGLRSAPGKSECLLLDHSGNIIRFLEDYEDIYFNGLDALDMAEKLDKTVRRQDDGEAEPKGCPKCGIVPFYKRCMSCGFEIIKPSLTEYLPGEMREIKIGNDVAAASKTDLWAQLCAYARAYSAPDKQEWRARNLYSKIIGESVFDIPLPFDKTGNAPITRATMNKIKQMNIAYAKSKH